MTMLWNISHIPTNLSWQAWWLITWFLTSGQWILIVPTEEVNLSALQVREHGVDWNDKARHCKGIQNMDDYELPLSKDSGLPTLNYGSKSRNLNQCYLIFITSDLVWDWRPVTGNNFGNDSFCYQYRMRLEKIMRKDWKPDWLDLVHAVRHLHDVVTSSKPITALG